MFIGADHFTQCVGKNRRMRKCFLCIHNHPLEGIHGISYILTPRFGPFNTQAELEILLVADKDLGEGSDFPERITQLFLSTLPECGPVVQVKGNKCAMLFGKTGYLQTEVTGVRRQCRYQTGEMYDLHTFLSKDTLEVKILHAQGSAHLTRTIVLYAGTSQSEATVGDVELMAVAPGITLWHLRTFIFHVSCTQIGFDECSDRALLYKGGQHLYRKAQVRGDAGHIRFGAGSLHLE